MPSAWNDNGRGFGDGMVIPENQLVSSVFMQNDSRDDSLILTGFAAHDWQAKACSPFWGQQSVSDPSMEDRDEICVGFTYPW